MYGVESATSGQLGGLAAQVPGGDLYFAQAAGISNVQSSVAGSPGTTGVVLPWSAAGEVQSPAALADMAPPAAPVSQQQSHWSNVLDFHGNVAPWILLAILFLYGWLHLSVNARAGRTRAGAFLG